MDFGSEYILDEEEEQEEEEMPVPVQHRSQRQMPPSYAMGDSGGFECEIMEFSDEEGENPQAQQKAAKPKKVDTNTVNLTMESLTKDSDITLQMSQKLNCKGDKCGAIFSHLAKVENGKKIWKCPFCDVNNEATGELPNLTAEQTDVMYVEDANKLPNLEPPQDKNDYSIIFVVDASASMCQTLEIPRESASKCLIELYDKGLLLQQQFLAQMSPDDNMRQMILQMRSAATLEVTRMMLVKDAVITVLEDLKSKKPNVRVGLVVFNEKVMVLGDGRSKVEVDNEKLMDKTDLKMIGQQHSELRPISESADDLKKEIEGLQEEGRTALGPALLIAEKMARSKGSKVILLTDGCANIGLGKLEESTQKDVDEFYDNVIMTCKIDGVSVSIISCDEAGIKTKLGDIPDETGGIVDKINASEYKKLLKDELERQAAATDGLLNFVVGKNMYVKLKDDSIKNSRFAKIIGNIHLGKKIPLGFAMQQSPDPQQQQTTSTSAPGTTPAATVGSASALANATTAQPAPVDDSSTNASAAAAGTTTSTSSAGTSTSTDTPPVGTDKNGHDLEKQQADNTDMDQTETKTGDASQPPSATNITDTTDSGDKDMDQTETKTGDALQPPSATSVTYTTDSGDKDMDQTKLKSGDDSQPPAGDAAKTPAANQEPSDANMADMDQTDSETGADTKSADAATTSVSDQGTSDANKSDQADSGNAVTDHSDGGEANTAAQPQQQPQAQADGIQCPFQVQIKYTDMYGTVAWRVWTRQKKLTKSRQQAEDGMNTKSAVTSFMQTAADKVLAANDTERIPVVLKLTDECKEWQKKLNPDDDRNNLRKLSDFQELLVLIADKQKINDDLSTKLRAIKEDRSASALG